MTEEIKKKLFKSRKQNDILRKLVWFRDLLEMYLKKTSRASAEYTDIMIDIRDISEIIDSKNDRYSLVWGKASLTHANKLYRKYKDRIAIWTQ